MADDLYQLLGVGRDASFDEIKKNYRKLAREYHPDINPDPKAQEKFKEITTAYETLSDPDKRQRYDLGGDSFGSPFGGNFGFGDIMDAFFGAGTSNRGPRPRARAGEDALIQVEIELVEACFGCEKSFMVETAVLCSDCEGTGSGSKSKPKICDICKGRGEVQQITKSIIGQVMTSRPCGSCRGFGTVIPDPCRECAGDGRVRSKKNIKVNIPAGVDQGNRIRVSGEGEVGPGGGPAGDLYVEVHIEPHHLFERVQDDLHCLVNIPFAIAILGGEVEVETFEGLVKVEIKPGTNNGEQILVPNQGMTRLHSHHRGNIVLHANLIMPKKLDEKQMNLISEFAKARNENNDSIQLRHLRDSNNDSESFFQRHFGRRR
jgi:molecular chaperone DnaJ